MKIIRANLGDVSKIKIIPLSDLHIGSSDCNLNLIRKTIKQIQEEENTYTIINGDVCDNTTKDSVGSVYENQMMPMEQVLLACELLEPIKDKILVYNSGNHEDRTLKNVAIDLSYLICKQLGIEDKCADGFWYLYLRFGKCKRGSKRPMVYTISGYHGSGGGRAMGGKANRLVDMSNIAIADIYIMGHTHTPIATKKCIYLPDYGNSTLTLREMHYLMTNAFLDYGGYGEKAGYHPSSNSICYAELDGRVRKIKISI